MVAFGINGFIQIAFTESNVRVRGRALYKQALSLDNGVLKMPRLGLFTFIFASQVFGSCFDILNHSLFVVILMAATMITADVNFFAP